MNAEWIHDMPYIDRARLASREGQWGESNPKSTTLWEHGNSLADNIRILTQTRKSTTSNQ